MSCTEPEPTSGVDAMLVELLGVPGCGKTSVIERMRAEFGHRASRPRGPRSGLASMTRMGHELRVCAEVLRHATGRPPPIPLAGGSVRSLTRFMAWRTLKRARLARVTRRPEREERRRLWLAYAYYRNFTFPDTCEPYLVDGGPMRRLVQYFAETGTFVPGWIERVQVPYGRYVFLLGQDPHVVVNRRRTRDKPGYKYRAFPHEIARIAREWRYLRECHDHLLGRGCRVLVVADEGSVAEKAVAIDAFLRT